MIRRVPSRRLVIRKMEVLVETFNGSMIMTPASTSRKRSMTILETSQPNISASTFIARHFNHAGHALVHVTNFFSFLHSFVSFITPPHQHRKEKKQHGGGVGGKGDWKDVDDGSL